MVYDLWYKYRMIRWTKSTANSVQITDAYRACELVTHFVSFLRTNGVPRLCTGNVDQNYNKKEGVINKKLSQFTYNNEHRIGIFKTFPIKNISHISTSNEL